MYTFVKQTISTDLVTLNEGNFNSVVVSGDGIWMIDFSGRDLIWARVIVFCPYDEQIQNYSDDMHVAGAWCGPCTMLKPHVRRMASELSGIAKLGIVDCDSNRALCSRLGVQYYPQLRLFAKGKTPESKFVHSAHYVHVQLTGGSQPLNVFRWTDTGK